MRTCEHWRYPTHAQRQQLLACLQASRTLYNERLAVLHAPYEAEATFPTKDDLNLRFKGRGGEVMPALTSVQLLSDRLSQALKQDLHLQDRGVPVGCPRVKTPTRWHRIQLRPYAPSWDVWLDENGTHLHVPATLGKLGRLLTLEVHRPLVGTLVTAHRVLRADPHGYALLVCETTPQDEQGTVHPERVACAHPAIGLETLYVNSLIKARS